MEAFEMTIDIERRPDDVFAFVSDLGNDPRWRREWVEAKRATAGPIGVGTSCALYAKVLGRRTEAVYEITEYEPNRSVTWKTVSGPLPLSFWRSVDGSSRGTRVTMGYSGEFHGFLGLLRPILIRMGERALRGDLPTLKQALESRH